jgi:hypothetical protein
MRILIAERRDIRLPKLCGWEMLKRLRAPVRGAGYRLDAPTGP